MVLADSGTHHTQYQESIAILSLQLQVSLYPCKRCSVLVR